MNAPKVWKVGDRVKISPQSLQIIENANRSIKAYPSDSYVKKARYLSAFEVEGVVERRFAPGYEVNVEFDNGVILQVKDNWIEEVAS